MSLNFNDMDINIRIKEKYMYEDINGNLIPERDEHSAGMTEIYPIAAIGEGLAEVRALQAEHAKNKIYYLASNAMHSGVIARKHAFYEEILGRTADQMTERAQLQPSN